MYRARLAHTAPATPSLSAQPSHVTLNADGSIFCRHIRVLGHPRRMVNDGVGDVTASVYVRECCTRSSAPYVTSGQITAHTYEHFLDTLHVENERPSTREERLVHTPQSLM